MREPSNISIQSDRQQITPTNSALQRALQNRNSDLSRWFREDYSEQELGAMTRVDRAPSGTRHIGNEIEITDRGPMVKSRIWIDRDGKQYREVY